MKKIVLVLFLALGIVNVQAQHFDLSLAGGFTETLQTGDYFTYARFSKPGSSPAGMISGRYLTKSGFTVGLSAGLAKLWTRQGWSYTGLVTNISYPVNIYFGTSYNADVLAGYTFRQRKSSVLASAFFGYVNNSNGSDESAQQGFVHVEKTHGFDYGVELEYQHNITQKLGVGLLLKPTFIRVHGANDLSASLFSMKTLIAFHYHFK